MRIIAGRLKGRRLDGPPGDGVRPTSDSLRETLFNVLGQSLDGVRVLDGFAGTGALGIEALSRGASHVTFVERDRPAATLIERNLTTCGVEADGTVIRDEFARWCARAGGDGSASFDLILLDPPYDLADATRVLAVASGVLAPGGRVVLEHARRRPSPPVAGGLARMRVVEAGDSALSFYALAAGGR